MKIICLQHEPEVGPGTLTEWASSRNVDLHILDLYDKFETLSADEADALVILGGSMNVYQEAEFPFLKVSKELIKEFIDSGKKVFGICLGAQLISTVLGAEVRENDHKEIGWWEVQVRPNGYFSDFSPCETLFHWHGDIFELPQDAVLWASTGISSHQAYTVGDNILAVQFHPEMNAELINTFIERDLKRKNPELGSGLYAQSAEEIKKRAGDYVVKNERLFFSILDSFFDVIEGGPYKNTLV